MISTSFPALRLPQLSLSNSALLDVHFEGVVSQSYCTYSGCGYPYLHAGSIQALTDEVAADPTKRNIFMTDGYESEWARPAAAQLLALPYDYPNKKFASIYADDAWSPVYSRALGSFADRR